MNLVLEDQQPRQADMATVKSVKFDKSKKADLSAKKKFAKTPHSNKRLQPPNAEDGPELKGRKLNFDVPETSEKSAKNNIAKPKISKKQIEQEKTENTIFVGNLPSVITQKDVKECFSVFGKVLNARIRCLTINKEAKSRKAGAILKDIDGDSASAYVRFDNAKAVQQALKANGVIFEGRHLRIDNADPKASTVNKKNGVFLRNLHYDVTEDDIWKLFEDCGEIESVKILRSPSQNYTPRGMGFVNFKASESVQLALQLAGTEMKGRSIRVFPFVKQSAAKKIKKKVGDKVHNAKGFEERQRRMEKKKNRTKQENGSNFSGNKASQKKKKTKKFDAEGRKKKKLAEILAK